jgi:hypothetical protein
VKWRVIQYWFETSQTPLKNPRNAPHKNVKVFYAWNVGTLKFFLTHFKIIISKVIKQKERNYIFFLSFWLHSPQWARTSSFTRFLDHNDTQQSVGLLWTSDKPVAVNSTWQLTTLKTDWYPCSRRDSNPQSQQANGRRPTPETARPLGSAKL